MSVITPGIELYLGNTRWLPLRLRRYGRREPFSVSGAQKIAIEFSREGEAPLPPIYASRSAVGADWIGGVVPVLVSPADITARVGTYYVTVTVFDPPVVLSASHGVVEVLPRPILGALPMPSGGAYTASQVLSGTNGSALTIRSGMPVHRSATGIVPAQAGTPYAFCDGVAIADTAPGATCLYIPEGAIRLTDWTPVFGSSALPIGATLYLGDPPGTITATLPVKPPSDLRQTVGMTDNDTQTLNVEIDHGVVL